VTRLDIIVDGDVVVGDRAVPNLVVAAALPDEEAASRSEDVF
jgi:hypothetical protein